MQGLELGFSSSLISDDHQFLLNICYGFAAGEDRVVDLEEWEETYTT